MAKINKITVENFRGIKSPVIIDFNKGGRNTSALIYGRNGTGKSSIVDAWEWLLNTKIDSLSKEGISERDYPHKLSNGDNVYINVDINNPEEISARATFNKARIKAPIYSDGYGLFKTFAIYPNYLRYSDLQEFVFKSKGDKYKYIAKFFGLEQFIKNQSDIQSSLTRISNQHENAKRQLALAEQSVVGLINKAEISDAEIISFINTIATNYNIDIIDSFQDSIKVKAELANILEANPIAAELAELKSFQLKLNQFYNISKIVQDCKEIETIFNTLKQDEENITKLILINLYDSANDTLSKLEDKSVCPVCDKVFDGDLAKHISDKHKALNELNNKKKEYIKLTSALAVKLTTLEKKIAVINSESSQKVRELLHSFFVNVKLIADSFSDNIELETPFNELKELNLSSKEGILKIDEIIEKESEIKQIVADRVKLLSEDKSSKKLSTDFTSIVQTIDAYVSCLRNSKKVNYLSSIIIKLNLLFTNLTTHIQTEIQNTFTAIQADLNYCYNYLESSNQFLKNPEIKLVTGRDKAVELEIEFVDEKISPAYKFMSESQVNSFGLAIFLSAVKYFNSDFKFIILDDVVNSFDAFKRPKVSQLLAAKFNDFQVLMLTHDQIFFDTVQRDFPQWNRYKFKSWDYTTGPRCSFSKNYIEEIQDFIDDDNPIAAGQKLGRYLEMVFGIVNQNLKTPIQYKLENVYTLSEFYNPLVKRFKDKLKLPNKIHLISNLFLEFEQGTIFRNYCAHYKNEETQFTAEEIDAVFKKWLEIEAQIYCEECKSYCHLENINNTNYVRCNCGTLNLMDESKFIDR